MLGTLYINKSDDKVVNKQLIQIGEYNIVFKDDENIINPILKITDSNISKNANYLFLNDLGRFYYIRKKTYSRQCILIECEVDVLRTYKGELANMEAIISRNERLYNLYLNDDKIEMYNYPYYQTLNMSLVSGKGFNMQTNNIILSLVGAVTGEEEATNGT